MAKRPRDKINRRRLAALMLSQLYRIASVLVQQGEVLEPDAWLKTLANILSSAPPPSASALRRNREAGRLCLSNVSLTEASLKCGVAFSREMVDAQVKRTLAWREEQARLAGEPVYRPMKPDTIGKLLGVTEEVRLEAKAWNVGTLNGSQKARKEAHRKREIARMSRKRAAGGARQHATSASRRQPWRDLGMGRTKYYALKAEGKLVAIGAVKSIKNGVEKSARTNSSQPIKADRFVADSFVATNKESADKFVATNIGNNRVCASSPFGLEACANRQGFQPADPYTIADVPPDGLAAKALALMARTPPPRDYEAENLQTHVRRARKRAADE